MHGTMDIKFTVKIRRYEISSVVWLHIIHSLLVCVQRTVHNGVCVQRTVHNETVYNNLVVHSVG